MAFLQVQFLLCRNNDPLACAGKVKMNSSRDESVTRNERRLSKIHSMHFMAKHLGPDRQFKWNLKDDVPVNNVFPDCAWQI